MFQSYRLRVFVAVVILCFILVPEASPKPLSSADQNFLPNYLDEAMNYKNLEQAIHYRGMRFSSPIINAPNSHDISYGGSRQEFGPLDQIRRLQELQDYSNSNSRIQERGSLSDPFKSLERPELERYPTSSGRAAKVPQRTSLSYPDKTLALVGRSSVLKGIPNEHQHSMNNIHKKLPSRQGGSPLSKVPQEPANVPDIASPSKTLGDSPLSAVPIDSSKVSDITSPSEILGDSSLSAIPTDVYKTGVAPFFGFAETPMSMFSSMGFISPQQGLLKSRAHEEEFVNFNSRPSLIYKDTPAALTDSDNQFTETLKSIPYSNDMRSTTPNLNSYISSPESESRPQMVKSESKHIPTEAIDYPLHSTTSKSNMLSNLQGTVSTDGTVPSQSTQVLQRPPKLITNTLTSSPTQAFSSSYLPSIRSFQINHSISPYPEAPNNFQQFPRPQYQYAYNPTNRNAPLSSIQQTKKIFGALNPSHHNPNQHQRYPRNVNDEDIYDDDGNYWDSDQYSEELKGYFPLSFDAYNLATQSEENFDHFPDYDSKTMVHQPSLGYQRSRKFYFDTQNKEEFSTSTNEITEDDSCPCKIKTEGKKEKTTKSNSKSPFEELSDTITYGKKTTKKAKEMKHYTKPDTTSPVENTVDTKISVKTSDKRPKAIQDLPKSNTISSIENQFETKIVARKPGKIRKEPAIVTVTKPKDSKDQLSDKEVEDLLTSLGFDFDTDVRIVENELPNRKKHYNKPTTRRPRSFVPRTTTTRKPKTQPTKRSNALRPHKETEMWNTENHKEEYPASYVYMGSHNKIFPGLYSNEG